MIRMIPSTSAGHAKAYFSDALMKSDYYMGDQELQGYLQGKLAERIGITGVATKDTFFALCENINPGTGEPLTPRKKDDRTTGYDINFHCPKSVSIVHALTKDDDIMKAFQESVAESMGEIEADAQARVRKNGTYSDRETGELAWATFVHQTSRPVDDHAPDPHLHAHAFVFNATWDEQEQQYKAAKFREINRSMPYYQARFHKRLSDKLMNLGFNVKRTDNSFEIDGVPQAVIDLFSKRTDEIGRVAKEKGITDAKELDGLGARTRSAKQKGMSMEELKIEWKRQIKALPESEATLGGTIRHAAPLKSPGLETAKDCVDFALSHAFERASVMSDRRILQVAYRHGIGRADIDLGDITKAFKADESVIHIKDRGQTVCTTREVLKEEQRMVSLAKAGMDRMAPLYKKVPAMNLSEEQAAAVGHILTTANRVSIIRGAAGTGKTTLMQEAVKRIEDTGKKVIVVAPTAQASHDVLKKEGFEKADTVARLLVDTKMQNELEGQVLWVDEAGLLGTRDMKDLLEIATKKNAQLILGGDTRQHASVVRGDALRILNTVGGIKTAEVNTIYRQKNASYREAVKDLSDGNIKAAFERLDTIGAVKAADPMSPHEALVKDYLAAVNKGKSALIISPTHKFGDEVTDDIRKGLRKAGKIGKKELAVTRYQNMNLTEAEKSDWQNFRPGHVVQFNQNGEGIKRGSRWTVSDIKGQDVFIKNDQGKTLSLQTGKPDHYDVYRSSEIGLSKGDKVLITRNGFDQKDKRLNNGQSLEVVTVSKKGEIKLINRISKATFTLDKDFGHIAHAHCITSHASQGKTVDEVFIAQPAATFPATDAKQFYVSVSRGREAVHIYTDDKTALLDHASEMGDRRSAMELVGVQGRHKERAQELARSSYGEKAQPRLEEAKTHSPTILKTERDYEPGF